MEDYSIQIYSPIEAQVNQRCLLNLNSLNFDFGLYFSGDRFMPFFGEKEIGLFKITNNIDEVENGDICLLVDKMENKYWLATKENTGFFTLDLRPGAPGFFGFFGIMQHLLHQSHRRLLSG